MVSWATVCHARDMALYHVIDICHVSFRFGHTGHASFGTRLEGSNRLGLQRVTLGICTVRIFHSHLLVSTVLLT